MLGYQRQLKCPVCTSKNTCKNMPVRHSSIIYVDYGYQFSDRQLYPFVLGHGINHPNRIDTADIKFR